MVQSTGPNRETLLIMTDVTMPAIQVYQWQEICREVAQINMPLFEIIESMAPEVRARCIKISYHYGDLIINNGVFHVPVASGKTIPLSSPEVPQWLRKSLSYCEVPLGLLLNKHIEVYVDMEESITPLNSMIKGQLIGLFEVLDAFDFAVTKPFWSVSAGIRSAFLLPKISERNRHMKLSRKFSIPNHTPTSYHDHWLIFQGLANVDEVKAQWKCEVLFFTNEWFEYPKDDPSGLKFLNFLYGRSWQQARFARDTVSLGLMWKRFTMLLDQKGLKPRPYLADTVKNMIAIAKGAAPAFVPSSDSEDPLPAQWIKEVYVDLYGLKEYLPTIMHLSNLKQSNNPAVYYSLSHPILLAGSESGRQGTAIMTDLRDLKLLLDTLKNSFATEEFHQIHNTLEGIQFDFYHTELDNFQDIQPVEDLIQEDTRFSQDTSYFPDRTICLSSPFLRGCVRTAML